MRPDLKILHLARDEKFVPLLRRLFDEALPVAQTWLIAHRARAPVQFVGPGPGVQRRPEWRLRTPLAALDLAQADVIVAHSMPRVFAQAIARARPSARVVWIGWGYDYYPLLSAQLGDPWLPLTRRLMGRGGPQTDAATPATGHAEADDEGDQAGSSEPSGRWRRWRRFWAGVGRRPHALQLVAPRIHTFCVLPPEEALLRRALPALQGRPHELPLFTTEDVFERGPAVMDGPDILLGNSATASNNHADAMALLAGRTGAGRLVVPLSYGDAGYGDRVVALGRQQFGDRFEPLRDWMPLDAYNARLGSCGFVVMNHRRQQAVGNIGAALFKGATVYLRRENPLFDFYTGLGIALRPIEALADGGQVLQPLSAEQRERNRALIGAHYARSRVLDAIRQLPALQG